MELALLLSGQGELNRALGIVTFGEGGGAGVDENFHRAGVDEDVDVIELRNRGVAVRICAAAGQGELALLVGEADQDTILVAQDPGEVVGRLCKVEC